VNYLAVLILVLAGWLFGLACLFTAWYYARAAAQFSQEYVRVEKQNSYLQARDAVWLTTVREQARHSVRLYEQNMALRELPIACEGCPTRQLSHAITVPLLEAVSSEKGIEQ
jgi:hypothetical protein